jgi:hypothetical protein
MRRPIGRIYTRNELSEFSHPRENDSRCFGCGGKKSSRGRYEILIAVEVVFLNRRTVTGLWETRCLEMIESRFYGMQRNAYKLRSLMGEETKT